MSKLFLPSGYEVKNLKTTVKLHKIYFSKVLKKSIPKIVYPSQWITPYRNIVYCEIYKCVTS